MNICIPVNDDHGLQSTICEHFGSAPFFMIVDVDSGTCRPVVNGNQHHGHGQCRPLSSIQGEQLGAVVVGGIGMGALAKLSKAGLCVYLTRELTVGETVDAFKAGRLKAMQPGQACRQHRHQQP